MQKSEQESQSINTGSTESGHLASVSRSFIPPKDDPEGIGKCLELVFKFLQLRTDGGLNTTIKILTHTCHSQFVTRIAEFLFKFDMPFLPASVVCGTDLVMKWKHRDTGLTMLLAISPWPKTYSTTESEYYDIILAHGMKEENQDYRERVLKPLAYMGSNVLTTLAAVQPK